MTPWIGCLLCMPGGLSLIPEMHGKLEGET